MLELVRIILGDYMCHRKKKGKVSLEYNLELERQNEQDIKKKGYDFVPRQYHWTSIEEQKIKVEEIEEKTKKE